MKSLRFRRHKIDKVNCWQIKTRKQIIDIVDNVSDTMDNAIDIGKKMKTKITKKLTGIIKYKKITDLVIERNLNNINLTDNAKYAVYSNRTEAKLFDVLSHYYKLNCQFKTDWCKSESTGRQLPFDFVIAELCIIIELDGDQHFKQVMNWQSPEVNQQNDIYKTKQANSNGYSIIRILQTDVWNNKNGWLDKLIAAIERIRGDSIVQNMYIASSNVYDKYMIK